MKDEPKGKIPWWKGKKGPPNITEKDRHRLENMREPRREVRSEYLRPTAVKIGGVWRQVYVP
jgi:hypothetical protein